VVIAPRLERLLVIAGDPGGAVVRDVRIEGLTFAHAAWPIPRQGQAMPQAEINLDGAISATHAEEIVLKLRGAPCGRLRHGLGRWLPPQPDRIVRNDRSRRRRREARRNGT
jgi:hypothetical protein